MAVRRCDLLKNCTPHNKNALVEQALSNRLRSYRISDYLFMFFLNAVVVVVLASDLHHRDIWANTWTYMEFGALVFFAFVGLHCLARAYICFHMSKPVRGSKRQLDLLDEPDTYEILPEWPGPLASPLDNGLPLDCALASWHPSLNEMKNCAHGLFTRPLNSNNSPRHSPSPHNSANNNSSYMLNNSSFGPNNSMNLNQTPESSVRNRSHPFVSPYNQVDESSKIIDRDGVREFMKKANESKSTYVDPAEVFNGKSYGFWNYYNKTADMLRNSLYQLAPNTPATTMKSRIGQGEDNISNLPETTSQVIKSISADRLSRYTINLRRWIATTILKPLIEEIDRMDEAFARHGFSDIQLGSVSLERLRKILENRQVVLQYFPMLPLLFPFLDLSTNQEYLVKRIRDLADGPCISQYTWNGGSNYGALKWSEHLPNDATIIFHLFCAYMDSQLLPLPQGEGRAFYSRYVIVADEKRSNKDTIALVKNRAHCAILYWNMNVPKFNFISDCHIHSCVYNRNNLFYVLIDFLLYMRTKGDSNLDGVPMGTVGINIMCTIEG